MAGDKPDDKPVLPKEFDQVESVEDVEDERIQDLHRAVDIVHGNAKKDIQGGTAEAYDTIKEIEGQLPDLNTLH